MIHVIFTLDYEIHGNGEGNPRDLMIEPTERMLELFAEYGAKLTIMADVAEIRKFKDYKDEYARDDYQYDGVIDQLQRAITLGHDVQLHIHSSYFNAQFRDGKWQQDWKEYDFANLPFSRMLGMIRTGKDFLEENLRPIKPNYRCVAFRAANWSVIPSQNVIRALVENDIVIDTSVFKYGTRQGVVNFDYTHAEHEFLPWPAHPDDICRSSKNGKLWEYPIYSEKKWIGSFLSINRIYRAALGTLHPVPQEPAGHSGKSVQRRTSILQRLIQKHAWKADFNQCSGKQLIRALKRAKSHTPENTDAPFILIGHPKLFTRYNQRSLRPFLQHISDNDHHYTFESLIGISEHLGQDRSA